jgi:hypothetical protein
VTADKLETIMELQREFQSRVPGGVDRCFKEMTEAETVEHIRIQILGALNELNEALGESGWKPWASSRHLNVEAFRGELIDMFRFWLNLVYISGMSADGVMTKFMESLDKTNNRIANGYDGVTDKCPACKRSYSDKTTKCSLPDAYYRLDGEPPTSAWWCQIYGNVNVEGDPIMFDGTGWVAA